MLPAVASLSLLLLSSAPLRVVDDGVQVEGAAPVRLTSVSRDGSACHTTLLESQQVARELVLSRACDVFETWLPRLTGAEQQFVITRRPAGRGDLVLHLDIADGWRSRDALGHHFGGPGLPGWSYGAAFVVREGAKRPLETRRVNGGLELVVPEAWLDAPSAFPLRIDPLVQAGDFELDPVRTVIPWSPAFAGQPALTYFPDGTAFAVWLDARRATPGRSHPDLFGAWFFPDGGRSDFALIDPYFKHDPQLIALDGGALLFYEDFSNASDHSVVFRWVPFGADAPAQTSYDRDVFGYGPGAALLDGEVVYSYGFLDDLHVFRPLTQAEVTLPLGTQAFATALQASPPGYTVAAATDAGVRLIRSQGDAGWDVLLAPGRRPQLVVTPSVGRLAYEASLPDGGVMVLDYQFTGVPDAGPHAYPGERLPRVLATSTQVYVLTSNSPPTNALTYRLTWLSNGLPVLSAPPVHGLGVALGADGGPCVVVSSDVSGQRSVQVLELRSSSALSLNSSRDALVLNEPLRRFPRVSARNGVGYVAWISGKDVRGARLTLSDAGIVQGAAIDLALGSAGETLDVAVNDTGNVLVAWGSPAAPFNLNSRFIAPDGTPGITTAPIPLSERVSRLRVETMGAEFGVFALTDVSHGLEQRTATAASPALSSETVLLDAGVLDFDVACDGGACFIAAAVDGQAPGVLLLQTADGASVLRPNARPPLGATIKFGEPLYVFGMNSTLVAHTPLGENTYSFPADGVTDAVVAGPIGASGLLKKSFARPDEVLVSDVIDSFTLPNSWSPDLALFDSSHGVVVLTTETNFSTTTWAVGFTFDADAGLVRVDAGVPDAGTDGGVLLDAGQPDAGPVDAGVLDGSVVLDAGAMSDGGTLIDGGVAPPGDAGVEPPDLSASGCSCASVDALAFALALLWLRRRR